MKPWERQCRAHHTGKLLRSFYHSAMKHALHSPHWSFPLVVQWEESILSGIFFSIALPLDNETLLNDSLLLLLLLLLLFWSKISEWSPDLAWTLDLLPKPPMCWDHGRAPWCLATILLTRENTGEISQALLSNQSAQYRFSVMAKTRIPGVGEDSLWSLPSKRFGFSGLSCMSAI